MKPKLPLHTLIFFAMAVGLGLGILLDHHGAKDTGWGTTVLWWLNFFGQTLFIGALKMIIAPLILASIVAGITSIGSFKETGRVGVKVLVYYVCTTSIAVAIGLVLVLALRPGRTHASQEIRADREVELQQRREQYRTETGKDPTLEANRGPYLLWLADLEGRTRGTGTEGARYQRVVTRSRDRGPGDMFKQDIVLQMLKNPFASLTEANSLGIIFFAILLALACLAVGPPAAPVVSFFRGANDVILRITKWIMSFSPFAVLCLVAELVAKNGLGVFASLGAYCGTVVGGIAIHVVVLLTIVALVGRMNPLAFLRGIREAWAVAFATRSSAATLPVTMRCLDRNLKVPSKISEFTLPVGATMNMDGTALYEGVAVIFLIQIYGGLDDVSITLGGAVTLVIFITAVLASVGAAAVPDAGLVTMVLVATAVGLPVYYIPLIFSVDAFLDMFRTSTNVMGDAAGAVVVARLEGARLDAPPPLADAETA